MVVVVVVGDDDDDDDWRVMEKYQFSSVRGLTSEQQQQQRSLFTCLVVIAADFLCLCTLKAG